MGQGQILRLGRALHAVNRLLARVKEEKRLLNDVCTTLHDLGDYEVCAIYVKMSTPRGAYKRVTHAPKGHSNKSTIPPIIRTSSKTRVPNLISDAICDRRVITRSASSDEPAEESNRQQKEHIALPLLHGGRCYGALYLSSSNDGFADKEVLTLLNELADDIALGVHAIRLAERQRLTIRNLKASESRTRNIIQNAPIPIMVHAEDGEVICLSNKWEELSGYNLSDIPTINDWVRLAYQDNGSVRKVIDNTHEYDGCGYDGEFSIHTNTRGGKETLYWQFYSSPLGPLDDGRNHTVSMAVDYTETRSLIHQLSESKQQLLESVIATIASISKTLEMRDPYTSGHQSRVTSLAVAISHEMGLDKDVVHGVKFSASIHDIGKIGIPSELLSKPSRLTDIEFELIKEHSSKGHEILKDIPFPWPVAETVRQHHERLDGSGYPDGLTESDILLEAKILAVSDVVEAITSHRPYRPGRGIDIALAEIKDGCGTRYDKDVVDACLKVVDSGFWFSDK